MKKSTEGYVLGLLMLIIGNTMHYPICRLIITIIGIIVLIIGAYYSGKENNKKGN